MFTCLSLVTCIRAIARQCRSTAKVRLRATQLLYDAAFVLHTGKCHGQQTDSLLNLSRDGQASESAEAQNTRCLFLNHAPEVFRVEELFATLISEGYSTTLSGITTIEAALLPA